MRYLANSEKYKRPILKGRIGPVEAEPGSSCHIQRGPLGTHCVQSTHAYSFPRKYASEFALECKVRKADNYLGWI